jgi:hypothetical protein
MGIARWAQRPGRARMHVCKRGERAHLETLVEIRSIDVETGNTEVCGDSEAPDVRMIGAKGEIWRLVLLGKEGNGCVAMRRRG